MNTYFFATFLAFYERNAGKITMLLAAVLLVVVWHAALIGGAIMPYDYQTADFPGYIDSLRAAKTSLFGIYDPFVDAGQVGPNLIAELDPPAWLPLLGRALPSYAAVQAMMLAHLLLIPLGLLLVAWANDVPRRRWIIIAAISTAAFAMGPTLKYIQHTNAIVSLGYLVLLFGALEAFRRTASVGFAILAGLAVAYSTEQWFYATVFLPIILLAYGIVNARTLFSTRTRVVRLLIGVIVAVAVTVPALLLDVHVNRTIEIARHLEQLNEITGPQAVAMLGAPMSSLPLVAIPAAVIALVVQGLRRAPVVERWLYGLMIAALILYGFGDIIGFGPLFRKLYPLAGVIRRPYAVWYVLFPFLLFMSAKGLRASSPRAVQIIAVASAVAVGLAVIMDVGGNAIAIAVVACTLLAMLLRPTFTVLAVALVVQWFAIDWIPYNASQWKPQPIAAGLRYFTPYETLRSVLPFETLESTNAYRIVNVGLPAEFGPSAGAFKFYNVAADYNTAIPHELVREVGTDQLHATLLPAYFLSHPAAFADERWKRLSVRYYLFSPEVFSVFPAAALSKPGLRVVPLASYWKVVEDTGAAPFVSAVEGDGKVVPINATMTRDSFRLVVPNAARIVRFAQHYDPWWKARDVDGHDLTTSLRDDDGQLALDGMMLGNRTVVLKYTDRATVTALAISFAVQLALIAAYSFGALRSLVRTRAKRPNDAGSRAVAVAGGE